MISFPSWSMFTVGLSPWQDQPCMYRSCCSLGQAALWESSLYFQAFGWEIPRKLHRPHYLSLRKCLWLFTNNGYHLNHCYNNHNQSKICPNLTWCLPHVSRPSSASVQCLRFSFFRESWRSISFNQMTNQKLTCYSTRPYMEQGCPMSNWGAREETTGANRREPLKRFVGILQLLCETALAVRRRERVNTCIYQGLIDPNREYTWHTFVIEMTEVQVFFQCWYFTIWTEPYSRDIGDDSPNSFFYYFLYIDEKF